MYLIDFNECQENNKAYVVGWLAVSLESFIRGGLDSEIS